MSLTVCLLVTVRAQLGIQQSIDNHDTIMVQDRLNRWRSNAFNLLCDCLTSGISKKKVCSVALYEEAII